MSECGCYLKNSTQCLLASTCVYTDVHTCMCTHTHTYFKFFSHRNQDLSYMLMLLLKHVPSLKELAGVYSLCCSGSFSLSPRSLPTPACSVPHRSLCGHLCSQQDPHLDCPSPSLAVLEGDPDLSMAPSSPLTCPVSHFSGLSQRTSASVCGSNSVL